MSVELIVILPAYNEELVIAKTITSILEAGMEPHQIYVINDASKDKTAKMAAPLGVNVITNTGIEERRREERRSESRGTRRKPEKNLGKANGVTNAIKSIFSDPQNSNVTHVCFMDADTLVDKNYFNAIKARLEKDLAECEQSGKEPVSVLCGRVKSIPHNWLTAFRAYELWLSQVLHKVAQSRINAITVAPGCASTYSVETLKHVVWSEDTATEDLDSTVQVALLRKPIKFEGDAVVYTQDPNTIKDYLGQIGRRWYPGTWQVIGKHKLLWTGWFKAFNWECRMMALEPMAYLAAIVYTALFHTSNLPWFMIASYIIVLPISWAAAFHEKRLDLFKYSFIFPIILMVNMFMFVSKASNIFGRRKNTLKWYSPERYAIK